MTLVTSPEHAARARRSYAERRPVRAALRRGEITIAEVMREQPAGLADRTLFEIVLMAHHVGRARLAVINAAAIEAKINLAVALERADEQSREWVAANALPHGRKPLRAAARRRAGRPPRPRSLWAQLHEE
jgi:ABC-type nitrate/sulfonate/bicarbonate transport system substrate-binding protein